MTTELRVLACLEKAKVGLSAGEVAKLLDLSPTHAAHVLRRLAAGEFIEKADTADYLLRHLWRAK